jgi:hypothetical protein
MKEIVIQCIRERERRKRERVSERKGERERGNIKRK